MATKQVPLRRRIEFVEEYMESLGKALKEETHALRNGRLNGKKTTKRIERQLRLSVRSHRNELGELKKEWILRLLAPLRRGSPLYVALKNELLFLLLIRTLRR